MIDIDPRKLHTNFQKNPDSSFGEEDMKSDFFTSFEKLIKEAVEKGYKTIFENLQINFSRSKLAETSD